MNIQESRNAGGYPPRKQPGSAHTADGIQWEYRVKKMDSDADLTQYGQDGWELIGFAIIPHDPTSAIYHFKRRRRY